MSTTAGSSGIGVRENSIFRRGANVAAGKQTTSILVLRLDEELRSGPASAIVTGNGVGWSDCPNYSAKVKVSAEVSAGCGIDELYPVTVGVLDEGDVLEPARFVRGERHRTRLSHDRYSMLSESITGGMDIRYFNGDMAETSAMLILILVPVVR